MTHTLPLTIHRFDVVGTTVIHCGRDVETFATEHDAVHTAAMLCEIFKDLNSIDLYDALFHHAGA